MLTLCLTMNGLPNNTGVVTIKTRESSANVCVPNLNVTLIALSTLTIFPFANLSLSRSSFSISVIELIFVLIILKTHLLTLCC